MLQSTAVTHERVAHEDLAIASVLQSGSYSPTLGEINMSIKLKKTPRNQGMVMFFFWQKRETKQRGHRRPYPG